MSDAIGVWSQRQVGRHACRVFEPARPVEQAYAVIYLHDRPPDQVMEHPGFTQVWDRLGLRVICPLAGPCWWTDRICPEFDPQLSGETLVMQEVLDVVRDGGVTPPRMIALCGVGMGGQGALRLAYRFPRQFPIVAAVSPDIDFHEHHREGDPTLTSMYRDAEAARQDTALLYVQPLNWPLHQWFCCPPVDAPRWFAADRLRMKLASLGVPHECDLETSGDDPFSYDLAMLSRAADFVISRLERERLRLV